MGVKDDVTDLWGIDPVRVVLALQAYRGKRTIGTVFFSYQVLGDVFA